MNLLSILMLDVLKCQGLTPHKTKVVLICYIFKTAHALRINRDRGLRETQVVYFEELMTMSANTETLGFQTEVSQLLHLVTHSLYSNKEIFLRELISNASDALDKLRFQALANSSLYEQDPNLAITILVDKDAKTITIRDNGIGMNRADVIEHLGTIAKSGTREFLQALSGEQAKDSQLIGQFGVGFYSAFTVADKVVVCTRKAGEPSDAGVAWSSNGQDSYTVESMNKPERGTDVILHINKDQEEFLDEWRIKQIIRKYSDHIPFPIQMYVETEVETETEEGKEEPQEKAKATSLETINKATALWTQPKSELKDSDYEEFYKHISHDFDNPLLWAHNRVEGKQEYISLLYIPKHAPFDLWNHEKARGLKLYVKRVFIMDDAKELLPLYLRFVKGVIDSNDLPLNVSREILQNNRTIESIRNATTKRILDLLEQLATNEPEKYEAFWQEFGQVLKEGPAEDFSNRERIAKLLRFASTHTDSETQNVSLDDYVSRMKPDQNKIYFITAESYRAAKNSPHLEIFRKKGIEVLLLGDRVDEWLMANLQEYQGKAFQSVAKGALDLTEEDKEEAQPEETEALSSLVSRVKAILAEQVKDVRLTHRLTSSPACLVADEHDLGGNIQRILKAAGQSLPTSKPILEINPKHPLVLRMESMTDEKNLTDWSQLLFEQALLAEGGHLDDPGSFVQRMNRLLIG